MVAHLGCRSSSPAPLSLTRLRSHALDRCNDATIPSVTSFFEWIAHACSNQPREISHIILTALARVAPWTGFYACCFDALVLFGASTILTGMAAGICDLALMKAVTP